MVHDTQAIRSCDKPANPLTPEPSGVAVSGPSASVRHPTGSQDANPSAGGGGPVLFLTELPLNVMPYLNLDPDFFGHPKCIKLVSLLGDRAEVYPIRLWCHAAKYHQKDGNFSGYSDQALAKIAGWDGAPTELLEPLVTTGFLDKTPTGYLVHDWPDHEGHLEMLKRRARMGAAARWKSMKEKGLDSHAKAMLKKGIYGKERIGKERSSSLVSTDTNTKITTRSEQPHQTLINRFLELKGTPRTALTRTQVNGTYARHSKSALRLIREAGGLELALGALNRLGPAFTEQGLGWTLDTIGRHLVDLKDPATHTRHKGLQALQRVDDEVRGHADVG